MKEYVKDKFNQALKRLQQNTPEILEQGSAVSFENVLTEAEISQDVFDQYASSLHADRNLIKLYEALLRFKNGTLQIVSPKQQLTYRALSLEAGLRARYIQCRIIKPGLGAAQAERMNYFLDALNSLLDNQPTVIKDDFNAKEVAFDFNQALIRLQNNNPKVLPKDSEISISNVLIEANISNTTLFEKHNIFKQDVYTIRLHEALNRYINDDLQVDHIRSQLSVMLLCTEVGIPYSKYASRTKIKNSTIPYMEGFKNFQKHYDKVQLTLPENSERKKANTEAHRKVAKNKKILLQSKNIKVADLKNAFNQALGRLQRKETLIMERESAISVENVCLEAQISKDIFDVTLKTFQMDCNIIELHEALERFKTGSFKRIPHDSKLTNHTISLEAGLSPGFFATEKNLMSAKPKYDRLKFFIQEFDKELINNARRIEDLYKKQVEQYKQAMERIINQKCIRLDNSIKHDLSYANVDRELNINNLNTVRKLIHENPILKKLITPEKTTLVKLEEALQRIIAGEAIRIENNRPINNYAVSLEAGLHQSTLRYDRKVYENIIKDIEYAENQRLETRSQKETKQIEQAMERIINQECIILDNSIKHDLTYTNVDRESNANNLTNVENIIDRNPVLKKLFSKGLLGSTHDSA